MKISFCEHELTSVKTTVPTTIHTVIKQYIDNLDAANDEQVESC